MNDTERKQVERIQREIATGCFHAETSAGQAAINTLLAIIENQETEIAGWKQADEEVRAALNSMMGGEKP